MKSEKVQDINSKIVWQGTVKSIQPRTRVWRYVTDNRTHYHLGYNLFLENTSNDNGISNKFSVAISEKQQLKNLFQIGDIIQGTAWEKKYQKREFADYYRAGSLKILKKHDENIFSMPPPWEMSLPFMDVYEQRGARILSLSRWKTKCFTCVWANMANVEIQLDFDRDIKKYRFETFCYGPKSCKYYVVGKARSVPYKGRDSVLDDGCLDEILTADRDEDD